jgi:hypothetical protein
VGIDLTLEHLDSWAAAAAGMEMTVVRGCLDMELLDRVGNRLVEVVRNLRTGCHMLAVAGLDIHHLARRVIAEEDIPGAGSGRNDLVDRR